MSGTAGTTDTGLLVDATELAERLDRELLLTDWRAIVAVVVAGPGLESALDRVHAQVLQRHQIPRSRVASYDARRDEAGRKRLAAINRARDSLLHEKRLIWLHASSAADVRFLRATAPDLLSAIDLFVELHLHEADEADWPTCRRQLCELIKSRHRMLDFTGLLPASVEQRHLPLSKLYQPLVELSSAAFGSAARDQSTPQGLLVLGHPGTGKTTFVRHLAWTYASGSGDPLAIGPRIPLLLSLSDYSHVREHDRVMSLVDFLPRWLDEQGISNATAISEHMPDVLLLLDGLDEMRSPDARRLVLREMSLLLRQGHVGGVVVTGRSFLVDELRDEDHPMRIVSTRAARPEEIRAFLEAFVTYRGARQTDVEDLINRIERDPDLRALARTPLMLAFTAILNELEGRLPDRRIEIYYRLGEMLVDRWTRARSIGTSKRRHATPTRADALRVLGPLAWWTVEQGGGAVPEAALEREIQRIEAKRETAAEAARQSSALLDLLRTDTALLVPRSSNQWSFVHRSVGEYFAGIHAERDHKRWHDLLEDPFRSEWREIVLFCCGQLGIIEGRVDSLDELVSAILGKSRRPGRYDATYPSLLIGLLEEMPGLSRQQTTKIAARLLELVLTMSFTHGAARQIQRDFVDLLLKSHGLPAEVLGEQLRRWFSKKTRSIRWDRLFVAGLWSHSSEPPRSVAHENFYQIVLTMLGPLLWAIEPDLRDRYQIEIGPTLARWKQETDWRYRVAEWFVTSSDEQLERPFGEVARELGLELA